jgi:deazaflavin-dependent oxidoreductase (nitroreductase family)
MGTDMTQLNSQPPVAWTPPSRFGRLFGWLTRLVNPLVLHVAGRRHFGTMAQLHHRGRVSGRAYVAPVGARPVEDGFLVPLTFGSGADWCRNVLAAGGCEIRWRDVTHLTCNPRVVTGAAAAGLRRTAFGAHERLVFRLGGIREFLLLDNAANPKGTTT